MQIVPLNDRVMIQKIEMESKTAGGLFIPDAAKEKPFTGKVLGVGPGHYSAQGVFIATTLQPGDVVVFGKYAGSEIEIDGKKLLLLKEEDVFGKVEE